MVDKADLVGGTPQRIMLVGPATEQGGKDAERLMTDLQGQHRALLPDGWRVERATAGSGTQLREPPSGTPDQGAVRSSVELEQDVHKKQQAEQQKRQQEEQQRKQANK